MRFLCFEVCYWSSAHAACLKIDMLTVWCRSSVVSVSFHRRLSVSMKIQGMPGTMRKNASASTGGESQKMLFHWCYGERCPQCTQADWWRDGVCTPELSGHASMQPWNITRCTRWFPHHTQGVHKLLGPLVDALEKVKKTPACIAPWRDPHKQLKFRPCVKTACYRRESVWQIYSHDYNKGSQSAKKWTHSCRLDELNFLGLCVSQP